MQKSKIKNKTKNHTLSILNSWRSDDGFTLIELILVVALFSAFVMALLTVLNPLEQFKKSNDVRRKSDLAQIQRALETYYQDHGSYPTNASQCTYEIKGSNGDGNDCIEWGRSWQPYMNVLPQDPNSAKSYVYYMPDTANGQTYYLYASLDRGAKDPQACNGGSKCTNVPSGATCGDVCNFGVSSPNVSP